MILICVVKFVLKYENEVSFKTYKSLLVVTPLTIDYWTS